MATRIYLQSSGSVPVTPSTWRFADEGLTLLSPVTVPGSLVKNTGSAMTSKSGSPAGTTFSYNALGRIIIPQPLDTQTISGTLKAQMRGNESATTVNATASAACKVVKPDGTDRGVPMPVQGSDLFSAGFEYTTTLTNMKLYTVSEATPITLTSVAVTKGDYLVIEWGFRATPSVAGGSVTQSYGNDSATDLPEDTSTTAANNPWFEFSATIWFVWGSPGSSAGVAASAVVGTGINAAVGSSAGVAASSVVGRATDAATAASAGLATALATGAETAAIVGSATGLATALATGAELGAGNGSASGLGDAGAIGGAAVAGAGQSDGTATVSGAIQELRWGDGQAAGSSAVDGIAGGVGSVARSDGLGDAAAVGTGIVIAAAQGSAAGAAEALGIGMAFGGATASAVGLATVAGIGNSFFEAIAASQGSGTAAGFAIETVAGAGSASGLATVTGAGFAIGTAGGVGSSVGTGAVAGVGSASASAVGMAAGAGVCSGVGLAAFPGVGSASGTGDAEAFGAVLGGGIAQAGGVGEAAGVGSSLAEAVGLIVGSATVNGHAPTPMLGGIVVEVAKLYQMGSEVALTWQTEPEAVVVYQGDLATGTSRYKVAAEAAVVYQGARETAITYP